MFGRGRPKNVAKVIDTNLEDEEENVDDEEDNEEDNEEEKTPIKKLVKEVQEVPIARISSAKIIGKGIYEYTLITNKLFGNIGEEFEI